MPGSTPDSEYLSQNSSVKGTQSEYGDMIRAVARLAARQDNAVARQQLLRIGLTRGQLDHLIAIGRLYPLHRGVYALGHTKLVPDGRLRAALLACGPGAFLSHRTAAGVLGLRPLALMRIEVTIPGSKARPRPGLIIHRTAAVPHRHEVRDERGLKISSVPRILIELAATESREELDRLLVAANRKHLLHIDRVAAAIDRHARRPGIGNMKAAIAGYLPHLDRKSNLERAFDQLLAENRDIPEPERNVPYGKWELDCYWPEQQVVLELDGRSYHDALANMESDRFKDAKLLAAGIRTMRATDRRFEADPEGVLADLRAILGLSLAA